MAGPKDQRGILKEILESFDKDAFVRKVQNQCGALMVERTQLSFENQQRGGKAWPPRAPINRVGILKDLEAGRNPPSRRFKPRPAGMDTGSLRASIAWQPIKGGIQFGSALQYATDFQEGGTVRIPLTGTLRKRLAEYLRNATKAKRAMLGGALGPVFRDGELVVDVPPRPLIETNPQDLEDCAAILELAVEDLIRGKG